MQSLSPCFPFIPFGHCKARGALPGTFPPPAWTPQLRAAKIHSSRGFPSPWIPRRLVTAQDGNKHRHLQPDLGSLRAFGAVTHPQGLFLVTGTTRQGWQLSGSLDVLNKRSQSPVAVSARPRLVSPPAALMSAAKLRDYSLEHLTRLDRGSVRSSTEAANSRMGRCQQPGSHLQLLPCLSVCLPDTTRETKGRLCFTVFSTSCRKHTRGFKLNEIRVSAATGISNARNSQPHPSPAPSALWDHRRV